MRRASSPAPRAPRGTGGRARERAPRPHRVPRSAAARSSRIALDGRGRRGETGTVESPERSAWRPVRRPELALLPRRDDGVVPLRDALLDREIQLGPVGSSLFERLDGTRTVEALLSETQGLE